MQRVLITGATGFIGGHLAESLAQRGVETRCLVRPTSNTERLAKLGATLVEGDVTKPDGLDEAVADVDVVFHLAGMITGLSKAQIGSVNGNGSAHIAEACGRCESPPTMVVLSSVAAAGPASADRVRIETDPVAPASDYGHSKREGELAVAKWADRIPITVLRPGIIFGPRDRLTFPIFQPIATWGVHVTVGGGKTRLALLQVNDLVELILRVAEKGERLPANFADDPSGEGVYFAAHDTAPSYREFGSMIARCMNRRVIIVPMLTAVAWSTAVASQTWAQMSRRPNPLSIDKVREAMQPSWAISNEKAKQQLDWRLSGTLEEQIQATCDWYEANGWIKVRRLFPQ